MSPLPTLIFCHGAWHTPEYWNPVRATLEGKGYRCIAPDIIFNGRAGDKAVQSMTPVINALQDVIAAEVDLGKDVVLVNHSFGGMAGVSAVKGFSKKNPSKLKSERSGHVLGLVQLTAWTPCADDVSLAEMAQDFAKRHPNAKAARLDAKTDESGWAVLKKSDAEEFFYGDISPEEAKNWVSKLINFSAKMGIARDSVYAGWRDVPMWYLICTEDKAIRREVQEDLIQRCVGANVTTRLCEASHSPMLSKPDETVKFIEDAVEAFNVRETS